MLACAFASKRSAAVAARAVGGDDLADVLGGHDRLQALHERLDLIEGQTDALAGGAAGRCARSLRCAGVLGGQRSRPQYESALRHSTSAIWIAILPAPERRTAPEIGHSPSAPSLAPSEAISAATSSAPR